MGRNVRFKAVTVAAAAAMEVGPNTRTAATLSETVTTQPSPITATISAQGSIVAGDTVFHDIAATMPAAATQYTVDAVGGGSITLSWGGGGNRTVTTGKLLSPGNHSNGVVRVVGYQLVNAGTAGTYQFLSAATALSGVVTMIQYRPDQSPVSSPPVCKGAGGQTVYVSATVGALTGWVAYTVGP
jgi:hypothetical protein